MAQALRLTEFTDGDKEKLSAALYIGESRDEACVRDEDAAQLIKKHARTLGYEPRRRVVTGAAKNLNG